MSKINQTRIKEIDRGFIALEVLGVLVIMALLALWGAEKYSEFLEEQEWIISARHISEFNEAAKHYIADHYDELLTQPKSTLNNTLLIKKGYLQKGFSDKTPFGQQYVTGIVRNNQKRPPALQALTCSVNGENLTKKGMRRIAAQINGMGGFVDERNLAIGAYSGWISQPKDFGLDCRYGHLAIALSSEILGSVLQESDRLYRFQVKHKPELNRMHNHIDMGGNNLNNAASINSQRLNADTVYAKGRIQTDGVIGLTNSHIAGTRCSTTGDISRDANGGLLSCQQGTWSGFESYPVGSPIPWPSLNIPPGYLACNGQAFNKTRFPKLARAYPYGILPDLRGMFIRGWDAGRGLDTGRQVLSYQHDENGMALGGGELHGHHNGMEYWYRDRNQEVRPKNIAFYYIVKAE